MSQEKRLYKRTELITYSRVYREDNSQFLGYVCDMSPSGLMTINADRVEPGLEITLKIEVPPLPVPTRTWMRIPAKAIWCQSDIAPDKFNIGWQFLATTAEDQEVIAAILGNYNLYENRFEA